ncbi:MAG: hypothetical protein P1U42_06580 [Phycisphaerales bacterium]|nr:hypothetical protein [Phycisphaerales bacterium]
MFQLKEGKTTLTDSGMIAIEKHLDRRLKRLAAPVVGVTMLVSGAVGWGVSSVLNHAKITTMVQEEEKAKQKLANIERDYEVELSSVESRFNNLFEKIYYDAYTNNIQLLALQESVVQKSAKVEVARLTAQNAVDNLTKLSVNADQLTKAITSLESAKNDIVNTVTDNLKSDFEDDETLTKLFSLMPIGSVIAWPGNSSPAYNWRECKANATAPYNEKLASALSNLYGNPPTISDKSSIKLPNFEGMFLRGAGGLSKPVGKQQGYTTAMPSDKFRLNDSHDATKNGTHAHGGGGAGGQGLIRNDGGGTEGDSSTSGSAHTHGIMGGDPETRPDNYAVVWLIRVE